MGVNRLNAVQKATYFLQKSKVGKNEECTVTVYLIIYKYLTETLKYCQTLQQIITYLRDD